MTDPSAPMQDNNRTPSLALLGSYVPRQCGIATFTNDLRNALTEHVGERNTLVLAMDDEPDSYNYPPDVRFQIRAHEQKDYRTAAELLNINQIDLTIVQHEYGIYGGQDGSYALDLMRRCRMPLITTLHTVLTEPTAGQRRVLLELSRLSDRLVVMSQKAVAILKETYRIPSEKIACIPHGIPDVPFVDPSFYKDQFGFEGRKVLLTFGLLSPGKGLEYAIQALPRVVENHPDLLYVILGATHPHILKDEGDLYRTKLERMVDKLGLRENVTFHNRFVSLDELVGYIGAADVYVTPYLNEQQITSGTLAYAAGAGKAIVSTPYWHAQELLADGRGVLTPFKDSDAMGQAINDLLSDDVKRAAMRKKAYLHCRDMVWHNVARQYLDLAEQVERERAEHPRRTQGVVSEHQIAEVVPDVRLSHMQTLSDDTGILSHAIYGIPDRRPGYLTDDNATALVTTLTHYDLRRNESVLPLMTRYLAFLYDAFDSRTGRFRGHLSYDRRWTEQVGSESTHARAVWALGHAVRLAPTDQILACSTRLFTDALRVMEQFKTPLAYALALLGLHAYLSRYSGDTQARRMRTHAADELLRRFHETQRDDWPWHDLTVDAEAARLPHALILSGQWVPDQDMMRQGLRTLDWLVGCQLEGDRVSLIGDNGWYDLSGKRANFDQRPTDAMALIEACAEAYRATREDRWIEHARRFLGWFLGENDIQAMLYDQRTGGCRDVLHADGPNLNQGAAATLAWLQAQLSVFELMREKGMADALDDATEDAADATTEPPAQGDDNGEETGDADADTDTDSDGDAADPQAQPASS